MVTISTSPSACTRLFVVESLSCILVICTALFFHLLPQPWKSEQRMNRNGERKRKKYTMNAFTSLAVRLARYAYKARLLPLTCSFSLVQIPIQIANNPKTTPCTLFCSSIKNRAKTRQSNLESNHIWRKLRLSGKGKQVSSTVLVLVLMFISFTQNSILQWKTPG